MRSVMAYSIVSHCNGREYPGNSSRRSVWHICSSVVKGRLKVANAPTPVLTVWRCLNCSRILAMGVLTVDKIQIKCQCNLLTTLQPSKDML